MSQHDPRLRYEYLFTSDLITLASEERKLLAREYIDRFSNIDIPMLGTFQEFWDIAQIPWEAIDTIAPKWWLPSVDERRIPHKHVEIAKEEDVELELYELQSHINFCQYLLETPEIAMIETYNRLIMQVNYSISDAGKALREQKPDERIVVVREPFIGDCIVLKRMVAIGKGVERVVSSTLEKQNKSDGALGWYTFGLSSTSWCVERTV